MKKTTTLCSSSSSSNTRKTRRIKMTPKLDRHGDSPSEYVIRNILNYSRALSIIKTHEGGTLKMVMN